MVWFRGILPDCASTMTHGGISKMAGLILTQQLSVNIMVHGGLWTVAELIFQPTPSINTMVYGGISKTAGSILIKAATSLYLKSRI